LIEHWDGTSWTLVPSASSSNSNALFDVSCSSASNCWSIGYYYTGIIAAANGHWQSLTEHWNNGVWELASSPNADTQRDNFVRGVTCTSAENCWAIGDFVGEGLISHTIVMHYGLPLQPLSIVSRKVHGDAGAFDVYLPFTGVPGIECRGGGTNGDYTLAFTFVNSLTSVDGASVTGGTGSVSSNNIDNNDAHNYIVNLTGVANAQKITVNLNNVTDSAGNVSSGVPVSMGVLIGDTNADGSVNSADISQTKSQSGNSVSGSNFREDLNADGSLNSADISLVKSKSGTALP
jgi:hypothetical protein